MLLTQLQPSQLVAVSRKNIILVLVLCICFELPESQPGAFIIWLSFLIPSKENIWFSEMASYIGQTPCT